MLGVYIHSLKDSNGRVETKGANPFANWSIERNGQKVLLSDLYPTYDWVNDKGRESIGAWIEAAAKKAGK